jgi:hypothetical protein
MNGITFVSGYGAVSVGTNATLINASNPRRKGLMIFNNSSSTLYIGMDANVTTSTGYPILQNVTFATDDLAGVWKGDIYGISSGTVDARFWEFGE